jgi:transposase InsO family protein
MLFERSTQFGNRPICGLRIWVVAVFPIGLNHLPPLRRRAVFSCVPALRCGNPNPHPCRGGGGEVVEDGGDVAVGYRFAINGSSIAGGDAIGKKLQRADAVLANGGKEAVGVRAECLNETLFSSLAQARAAIATWKEDYNRNRPHSSLGNFTPNEFATKMTLEKQAA